jgi:hypothetical protein
VAIFLGYDREGTMKGKTACIKVKHFCKSKDTIDRMKCPQNEENICKSYIDETLASRLCQEQKLKTTETTQSQNKHRP